MRNAANDPQCVYEHSDTAGITQSIEGVFGFAVLKGIAVDRQDLVAAENKALQITETFGRPLPQDATGRLTWLVRNEGVRLFEKTENLATYKSSKSGDALPFHTDGSAQWLGQDIDWMLLLAVVSDDYGGTTILVDATKVFAALLDTEPRLARRLCEPVPFDRSTGVLAGQSPLSWHPMFSFENGKLRSRLNTTRVRNTALQLATADDDLFAALDVVDEFIAKQEHVRIHLNAGDALLLDDKRVAHARTSFTSTDRLLIRTWIDRSDSPRCSK